MWLRIAAAASGAAEACCAVKSATAPVNAVSAVTAGLATAAANRRTAHASGDPTARPPPLKSGRAPPAASSAAALTAALPRGCATCVARARMARLLTEWFIARAAGDATAAASLSAEHASAAAE